ncbi:hypothetical protein B0675_39475 [Streptomyces sp. M41(2017)]|uniref:hypothetical protein n=1 Tax=Streptomyces sp. M41(2017) TaxID=1955065 RepID=UPI0009BCFF86|nr:hypothetical protein [Streptomyces sp. M41(2017)]OQQ13113.1 hypothetical protein B0675_39475 [Streptomyces sp. M41(2017)]
MPFIEKYVKSDGTVVRSHYRWAPGARREMTIVAAVAVAVVAFGHNGGQAAQDTEPRKAPGQYPVLFSENSGRSPRGAEPRPTVSYPIKFDSPKVMVKRPAPAVSYPIDFSTLGSSR